MKPQRKEKVKWSSDLAYAVGLITSDGSLSCDGRHIVLVSKDIQLLNVFKRILKQYDLVYGFGIILIKVALPSSRVHVDFETGIAHIFLDKITFFRMSFKELGNTKPDLIKKLIAFYVGMDILQVVLSGDHDDNSLKRSVFTRYSEITPCRCIA